MTRQLEIKQPFNLELSLMMGQAFRWQRLSDDFYADGQQWFSGVIGENLIHIRQTDDGVEYRVGVRQGERPATPEDDDMLRRYFREDDDVAAIYADIGHDPYIALLTRKYCGLRVLRQNPWECTVAYLCSARGSIERIARNVEAIAGAFGNAISLGSDQRHTFPPPHGLWPAEETAETLGSVLEGFKSQSPNIIAAAGQVASGSLRLYSLSEEPYENVHSQLSNCRGIGNKVADCIALMSLDKLDAFPLDRHIGRSLTNWPECPFLHNSERITDGQYRDTVRWAQEHFGPYAGYAGQFLFCDQPK